MNCVCQLTLSATTRPHSFAPESGHGANAGLQVARDLLEPVKKRFPYISYADLYTLAGVVAIEEVSEMCCCIVVAFICILPLVLCVQLCVYSCWLSTSDAATLVTCCETQQEKTTTFIHICLGLLFLWHMPLLLQWSHGPDNADTLLKTKHF